MGDEGADAGANQPPPKLKAEEKQWGALAHVSIVLGLLLPVIGGPLGPLVVRMTKGKESTFVDTNAVEALNFGILFAAAQLVSSVITGSVLTSGLGGIGSLDTATKFLPLIVTLAGLILPGMAALTANNGRVGRYPDALPRFVHEDEDESRTGPT